MLIPSSSVHASCSSGSLGAVFNTRSRAHETPAQQEVASKLSSENRQEAHQQRILISLLLTHFSLLRPPTAVTVLYVADGIGPAGTHPGDVLQGHDRKGLHLEDILGSIAHPNIKLVKCSGLGLRDCRPSLRSDSASARCRGLTCLHASCMQ